ncbi:MAG TPA: proline--tRNA ligase [bacterium]|nr:proline--tRNA ligase [bacterium]HQB10355.1 proline--tRNA ligase [bacterium]HRQ68955.1 proline--tRNA ligase [bacterium]
MKVSQIFFQTLKEVPKEAQIESHRLLYRAGMIQKLASGIYSYLPLVLRSVRKLENIIREELNKRGCQEVLMPAVQPAELWEESGRWTYYGPELLRFKDRKGGDFCLGPTHEEVITDMVRKNLRSYKQLPYNLYQFQSKFRDEIRPRFGLMRGREFIMKDGYSFDINEENAKKSYQLMFEAYNAIFNRCGLKFKPVDAATGAIGGDMSHEFQVLAEAGEDLILSCDKCGYAANLEKARSQFVPSAEDVEELPLKEVHTPSRKAVEDVAEFLGRSSKDFIKSMIYIVDDEPVLIMVPGDREVNEAKIQAFFRANSVALANDAVIAEVTGAETGFAGPVGLKKKIKTAVDRLLTGRKNLVAGANKTDHHIENININRDFTTDVTGDFVVVRKGEKCPDCDGTLEEYRGIEVGQVFYLGTKYSEKMNCSFVDESGKTVTAVMGCYGLGVGRTVQAAIEQNHDEFGIQWPMALAPYEAVVLPLQMNKPEVVEAAENIYKKLLEAGVETVIDDRDERAGFKFNDADLVGYPLQIIFGGKSLEKGVVEVKIRKTNTKLEVKLEEIIDFTVSYKKKELGLND